MGDAADPYKEAPLTAETQLSREQYRTLAEFRYLLRRFLGFSQAAARQSGLTATRHQALLAIKGFPGDEAPTVGDLAERLCIRHHSAVELVDRLEQAGLLRRRHDPGDRRRVQLALTAAAERQMAELSAIHLKELHQLGQAFQTILGRLGSPPQRSTDIADEVRPAAEPCPATRSPNAG